MPPPGRAATIVVVKLLVVEDEDAIAEPLVEGLEREGFEVDAGGDRRRRRWPRRARPRPARPAPAGHRRLRGLPAAARAVATCRSSSSAHAARRSTASSAWSSARTTTSSSRSACASSSRGSARCTRRLGARGRPTGRRSASDGLEVDMRARRATLDGQRARADAEGVRPARAARLATRARSSPASASCEEVWGTTLVRLAEDDRRPRRRAAQEARRPGLDRDRPRGRLPPARGDDAGGCCSATWR